MFLLCGSKLIYIITIIMIIILKWVWHASTREHLLYKVNKLLQQRNTVQCSFMIATQQYQC